MRTTPLKANFARLNLAMPLDFSKKVSLSDGNTRSRVKTSNGSAKSDLGRRRHRRRGHGLGSAVDAASRG